MFTGGKGDARVQPSIVAFCIPHQDWHVVCVLGSAALVRQRRGVSVAGRSFVLIAGPGVEPLSLRIDDVGQRGGGRGMRASLSHCRADSAGTTRSGMLPPAHFTVENPL